VLAGAKPWHRSFASVPCLSDIVAIVPALKNKSLSQAKMERICMAVTFRKGPKTLLRDLQKRGYEIASVHNADGNSARSIQIFLKEGVIINWDRDSRSVWAEGPWPQSHKAEAYLKRIYEGGWVGRAFARRRKMIVGTLVAITIVIVGARVFSPRTSTTDTNSVRPPPAPALADTGEGSP
jgi:hypothetical protein